MIIAKRNELGGETFAGALPAKFAEEVVLLKFGAVAQKVEQGIFNFVGVFIRRFVGALELSQVRGKGAWRNVQFEHGFWRSAQNVDQISYLSALFWGAGRELNAHAVSRVRDSNHAFGMYGHIFRAQAK